MPFLLTTYTQSLPSRVGAFLPPSGLKGTGLGGSIAKAAMDIAVFDISLDKVSCNIVVTNYNVGNIRINQKIKQNVWIDNKLADDTTSMFDISPNSSSIKTIGKRVVGTKTIQVIVDPDNSLQDFNRANNKLTKTLTCGNK